MPDDDLLDRYRIDDAASDEEFLAAAKLYARAVADQHDLSVDVSALEWSVSKRAKRRAGAVKHRDGNPESVVITRAHFTEHGWEAAAATVRHELIHVHLLAMDGDATHGAAFEALAEELDAPINCERFTDPEWWVICENCGAKIARYRRSKLVEQPGQYRCRDCGGEFRVEAATDAAD